MKGRWLLFSSLALVILFTRNAQAQDYDIQRYEANVQVQPAANAAQIQAKLALINVSTQNMSGSTVTLKLNKRAKVQTVQVDTATAQFRQKNDERLTELANITIDLPKSLAPGATTTITVTYGLEFKDSSPLGAISPNGTTLLPESFWLPLVHTPFTSYGPDAAPAVINITVDGEKAISTGTRRATANSYTFESTLATQPFLAVGYYDEPFEIKGGSTTFEFWLPRGINAQAKKQAEAIAAESTKILEFYNKTLGFNIPSQIRIATNSQVSSYATGTSLLFTEDLFRRDVIDLETVEFLARALSRSKIGVETFPRGKGWQFIQDALPTYLAGLYFEQRYGAEAGREFFTRRSRAYAPLAINKTDGALLLASPLDTQYGTTMFNKGPLLLKLMEKQVGQEKFLSIIKEFLKTKPLKFEALRKSLVTADSNLTAFFEQWFDKIVDPDFIIGVPSQVPEGWTCVLRNLGTGNIPVSILAITEKGDRLVEVATIPSLGRSEVLFKTTDKLVSVEVDPDKLYPQTNYDNDSRPVKTSPVTLFNDANTLFNKKDYAGAEAKLREAIKQEPFNPLTRTLLVRSLAAQNKLADVKAEIETINKQGYLPAYTLTWLNAVQGDIALAQGANREAVDYYHRATSISKDLVSLRVKLIDAERKANQPNTTDESIRTFINQLDKATREATFTALDPLINKANLNKFIKGLVGNKPDSWTTQILRIEALSADKVAVDVEVMATSSLDKKEQRGSGLYVLRRNQNSWILNNIEFFNIE